MSQQFDVYGVGNAIVDLQVQASDADLAKFGVEKSTMRLVDEALQDQMSAHFAAQKIRRSSGGSAANSMIALAQLGGRGAYAGIVADDEFGEFYRQEMEELGVVFHNAPRRGAKTGRSFILITPDAERTMNTFLGATATFGPEDVRVDLLKSSRWLFIEGYLFSSDTGRAAVERAVAEAKRADTRIAVTFSDVFIIDLFRDALDRVVASCDLIFANSSEAKRFTAAEDEEKAFRELQKLCPNVAVTRSEKGAWIVYEGREERLPAYPVQAIDDTGAGDMFAGAFLYGCSHGLNPKESGQLACFLASRVVAQFGARLHQNVVQLVSDEGLRTSV